MALAKGTSKIRTPILSLHAETMIALLQMFASEAEISVSKHSVDGKDFCEIEIKGMNASFNH